MYLVEFFGKMKMYLVEFFGKMNVFGLIQK